MNNRSICRAGFWLSLLNLVGGVLYFGLVTAASLVMMIIFATLTSLNRYTSLTVIPQSQAMGKTNGLEWFMPYGWPSIMAAMEVLA